MLRGGGRCARDIARVERAWRRRLVGRWSWMRVRVDHRRSSVVPRRGAIARLIGKRERSQIMSIAAQKWRLLSVNGSFLPKGSSKLG